MFKVTGVYKKFLLEYAIQDLQGDDILGKFLEYESQMVSPKECQSYKVKKVVRSKGKGTSKEFLILGEGYPDKFQTWILAKDLKLYW